MSIQSRPFLLGIESEPRKYGRTSDPLQLAGKLSHLHVKLIEGCPSATEEIADVLLPLMHRRFQRRFPSVDDALIFDAVIDEILSDSTHPEKVDPVKAANLEHLIANRIQRRIAHSLRSADRRRLREGAWADIFSNIESDDQQS